MEPRRDVIAVIARRLLPVLMLCYLAAFIDRVNIGFAALTMNADLGFSPGAFGVGAGIFFLGYVVCELPSNLVLARVGARLWIARIMITWGLLSAATAFVWNVPSFYTIRTLLGAAEAGFFPGVIYYVTLWFPAAYRARMYATFNVAVPLASIIGTPISGLILQHMDHTAGLHGWQWMFIIQGMPALIMGVVVLFALPDDPTKARFLNDGERNWLLGRLQKERADREAVEHLSVWQTLRDPRVGLMCLMAVGLVVGTTGIGIWMPQIVKSFGLTNLQTSFVAAIPAVFMGAAMILVGRSADRTGERVWHTAGPFLVSAAGFVLAAFAGSPVLAMVGLVIGAAGIGGASPGIWIFPTTLLTGTAAAAGIALINSTGSIGGFFGPAIIGWVREATGGFTGSLLFLAAAMAATAGVILILGYSMRSAIKTAEAANALALSQESLP